jgi:outer membrane lipoprotein SlyB
MKKNLSVMSFILLLSVLLVSCAPYPPDRFNTQRGAAIGAGAGALLGQAIGRNTEGTLIGLAAGTIMGALVGNAMDQDYQAARDAAANHKPVIYYDKKGSAVEAIPGQVDQKSNCSKVTKRVWQDGKIVSETVEEVCREPETVLGPPTTYVYPPYPPVYFHYYYGGRPYYYRPYGYYYPHQHGAYGWGGGYRW